MADAPKKKTFNFNNVRAEARSLVLDHKKPLAIGLVLMVINRMAGLVLPATPKYLIDEVFTNGRAELLWVIAGVAAGATLVQAITGYTLSQVVSVAAQGAIATMRKNVQAHVLRLPVQYYDSTKSGVLISRIMNDPEGIRNLIGTGIIQLVGGLLTAVIAFVVLLNLHWKLTLATVVFLLVFAGVISYAMKRLRPIFRKRGEITAEVTGRLAESLGGVRLVKTYVAEEREQQVFGAGVTRIFRNIASTITGTSAVSAFSTLVIGAISVMILYYGGKTLLAGEMKVTDLFTYVVFVGMMVAPLAQIASISTQITEAFAGLDRIREIRTMP